MVISEFESKEHEILNGVVARIDRAPAPLIWMLFPAARRARLFWPLPSRYAVRF